MIDLLDAVAWWFISMWNYLTEPIVDALDDATTRMQRRRSLRRVRKGRRPDRDDIVWKRPPLPADHLMSPAEIDAYIDTAFIRHADAPERECGAPHPAHGRRWCQQPNNHLWDTHEYDPEDPRWNQL